MATLTDTTDAMIWAEEFCRIFKGWTVTDVPQDVQGVVDQGGMVAWFASAIETGRNAGRKETCPHTEWYEVSEDMSLCNTCGLAKYAE